MFFILFLIACGATHALDLTCPQDSAWVGAVANWLTVFPEFGVQDSGPVVLATDCVLTVESFTYTFTAPNAVMLLADGPTQNDAMQGETLLDLPAGSSPVSTDMCVPIPSGTQVGQGNKRDHILIYSTTTQTVLAWAVLVKPDVQAAPPDRPTCELCPLKQQTDGACSWLGGAPALSCRRVTSYMNVWWSLNDTHAVVELEADVDTDHYVAFGAAPAGVWGMMSADLAVAGTHEGSGLTRVEDYWTGTRRVCNYADGGDMGVCADKTLFCEGGAGSESLSLVSGSRVATILRARYARLLDTADPCDHAITTGGRETIWGYGPLRSNPDGTFSVQVHRSHSLPGSSFDYGETGVEAACLFDPVKARSPQTVDRSPCLARRLIDAGDPANLPLIVRIVAANALTDHPDPPGFGLAYTINGFLQPELVLRRNVEVRFRVEASSVHPFYVTDSDVGVGEIFAGQDGLAFGTEAQPFDLNFTLDDAAPDQLYYQSFNQVKLGWRIYVRGADEQDLRIPADSATLLDPTCTEQGSSTTTVGGPGQTVGLTQPPSGSAEPAATGTPTSPPTGAANGYCPVASLNCPCTAKKSCDRGLGCDLTSFTCKTGVDPAPGAATHVDLDDAGSSSTASIVLTVFSLLIINL